MHSVRGGKFRRETFVLRHLHIQNVALIQQLFLGFDDGFHVLTGETGAGKSILIDAINFVLGERASRDLIKSGENKAMVEAAFSVSGQEALSERLIELGIEHNLEDDLILSRELTAAGKNTCRINGHLVNLTSLKSVSDFLVDVHGQHEHQSLLHPAKHRGFLDMYAQAETAPLLEALRSHYKTYREVENALNSGFTSEQERARRMDILQYQIDEIDAAALQPEEEETLKAQHLKMNNAQAILCALEESYEALSGEEGGALGGAGTAMRAMSDISGWSGEYQEAHDRLSEAYYALEDISYSIRALKNDFEFQPDVLIAVEERLDRIYTLKRKYGSSILSILELRDEMQAELIELQQSDELREKLIQQRKAAKEQYLTVASRLTAARKAAGEALRQALLAQLSGLGMDKAEFEVEIAAIAEDQMGENGLDKIEFLLSANAGEPVKPLSRVASGGELSRIMLAFKTVATDIDGIPTLIFDEIDTGISGHIATAVGQRLRDIASRHQVLCVTHLPQIAAMAQVHFFVEKMEKDGKTYTNVHPLDIEGRYREVARIMGAEEGDVFALGHAKELIDKSAGEQHK